MLDPGTGELASKGEYGVGRLPEPPELLEAVERAIQADADYAPRSLDGLKLLVSAGGTREPIDEVRFVGNRSSGKMGFAIADAGRRAWGRGHGRRRQRRARAQSRGRTT